MIGSFAEKFWPAGPRSGRKYSEKETMGGSGYVNGTRQSVRNAASQATAGALPEA